MNPYTGKQAEAYAAGQLNESATLADLMQKELADIFPGINYRFPMDAFIQLKRDYEKLKTAAVDYAREYHNGKADGRNEAAETIREMLMKALNSPPTEGSIEANIRLLIDERDDAIRQIRVMREALAVRDQFDRHAAMMLRLAASTDMTHAQREGVFKFLSAYMESLIGKRNGYDLPPPLPPHDRLNEIPF